MTESFSGSISGRFRRAGVRAAVCTAVGLASVTDGASQVKFTPVATAAGVDADTYDSDSDHSLGVNWIDYDGDGFPDLFMVNGKGLTAHLYRNEGDGTFSDQDALLPPLPDVEMSRSAFADYDNDGDSDIYIFTDNEVFSFGGSIPDEGPANLLLENLWVDNGGQTVPGQPLFQEVAAAAGVDDLIVPPLGPMYPGMRSKAGGWLDYDRDGCVDLYVGHMVVDANGSIANADRLYRNQCDGTFQDVTSAAGIHPGATPGDYYRPLLAWIGAHLDGDLWPDMYLVNVAHTAPYFHDVIYQNRGDSTFADVTGDSPGVGNDSEAGMGVDVADTDLDGDWEIYVSDLFNTVADSAPLGNVFYEGIGDARFDDNTAPMAGIAADDSWGVNFFDADQDGYEDLYVSGMLPDESFLFVNDGAGGFTDQATAAGIVTQASRGSATADYDLDGDLDLAVVDTDGGQLHLFRNETVSPGNWLQVRLRAVYSNRDAIGTVVKVTAGGKDMMRQVKGGSSGHGQDSLVVHFGLGSATLVDEVRVQWPELGKEDVRTNVAINQFVTVVEEDSDADGATDAADCASADADLWSEPGPVIDLALTAGTSTELTWSPPEEPGATAPVYDVMRSTDPQMGSVACLLTDSPLTSVSDSGPPPAVFFYVVRIENGCGEHAGDATSGVRTLPDCS